MKYDIKILAISLLAICLQNCSKDASNYATKKNQIVITQENLETAAPNGRYQEQCCNLGNGQIGVECNNSFRGKCKNLKACKSVGPLPTGNNLCLNLVLTESQLSNSDTLLWYLSNDRNVGIHMWQQGWFYHPDSIPE